MGPARSHGTRHAWRLQYVFGAYLRGPGMAYDKQTVYNTSSVYAEAGGGKQNILFYTDFSNYDTADYIDYPLIGDATQFSTNLTLTKYENYLSMKAPSGNVYYGTRINIIPKNRLTFGVSFSYPDVNISSFIWLTNDFAIAFDHDGELTVIVNTSFNVTLYNTTYIKTSAGFKWYQLGVSQQNKFEFIDIQFIGGDAIIFCNGIKILSFGFPSTDDFFISFDPRGNGTINAFNVLSY